MPPGEPRCPSSLGLTTKVAQHTRSEQCGWKGQPEGTAKVTEKLDKGGAGEQSAQAPRPPAEQ